eukprot:2095024-Amphidinium_carterae.1
MRSMSSSPLSWPLHQLPDYLGSLNPIELAGLRKGSPSPRGLYAYLWAVPLSALTLTCCFC